MVKNKFTITITDINGSRHFYLNQIIKKIVFYTIAFIVLFLVFSGFYIKYLDSKLSDISEKREELLKKSKELELSNSQMQKSIEEKTQQYAAIEDKIASFEEALGLEVENNQLVQDLIIFSLPMSSNLEFWDKFLMDGLLKIKALQEILAGESIRF